MRRFVLTTFLAWLVFLVLDFLAHAVLLNSFWAQDFQALKTKDELFRLIPFGYLSFLILTILFGWLYARLFKSDGNVKKAYLDHNKHYCFRIFPGNCASIHNILRDRKIEPSPF